MSMTVVKYDLAALLEMTGSRPPRSGRGKWDCGHCHGRACLSVNLDCGLYHCFHGGCDFSGNTEKLARQLGLARQVTPAEARNLRLERERADAAAKAFLVQVKGSRFGLDALHTIFLNIRDDASERLKATPNDDTAWDMLTFVHCQLPRVRAELALLCEGTFGYRQVWLEANEGRRREMADWILRVGGVPTFDGKWVEVE